jgi:hypothetical protein
VSIPPILSSDTGRLLLDKFANEMALDPEQLLDLINEAERHSGKLRRKGLFQAFDAVLKSTEL